MTDGPTPAPETWTDGELDALRDEFGAFAGRTVLVTGADGFMGSHVTEALVALGARVHVFVRATSSGALNNISHLRGAVTVHWGDINDRHWSTASSPRSRTRPTGRSSSTSRRRPTWASPGSGRTSRC